MFESKSQPHSLTSPDRRYRPAVLERTPPRAAAAPSPLRLPIARTRSPAVDIHQKRRQRRRQQQGGGVGGSGSNVNIAKRASTTDARRPRFDPVTDSTLH